MKTIYLVHCWDGTSNDGWYPWIKENLEKNKDVKVVSFDMPNTEHPDIKEWTDKLDTMVEILNDGVYFIGHSIGCQTIMRYLENKEIDKIGGLLFVAPWLDLLPNAISDEDSYNTAYPWINTEIDFNKIKKSTNNITCIFSDNDYFVSLDEENKFKLNLDAKTIIVKEKGHISADDDVFELKEILESAIEMIECN
ncbi:MAG: alpha/beta hydrolase [Clostridia bacterium]|nr:alpha/beta hydrolase [Clostridia bacterium]